MGIEHFSRTADNGWKGQMFTKASEEMIFESINCKLLLADIYAEDES